MRADSGRNVLACHTGTLVVVSFQRLFAEALGSQISRSTGRHVRVLSGAHPRLLLECRAADPRAIIVDMGTRGEFDPRPVRSLLAEFNHCSVVVLGEFDADDVAELLESGVRGFLTYSASMAEVARAVDAAAAGGATAPVIAFPDVVARHERDSTRARPAPALSTREHDVLDRLCAGDATKAIAAELGISVATVRKHVQNVLEKLGVHSRLEAAAYAVRHDMA